MIKTKSLSIVLFNKFETSDAVFIHPIWFITYVAAAAVVFGTWYLNMQTFHYFNMSS